MLAAGQDNALLRFSLANAYVKQSELEKALEHFRCAVQLDSRYSAAWKGYGKALTEAGRTTEALHVYEKGIAAAQEKGDIQAAKEMTVFLKRLEKSGQ